MSWATQAWAREVRTGSPGRKAVLLVLAEYADEEDSCFPSQATIAEGTELSVRTVRDRLNELEEAGLISRERRHGPGGSRTSDRYYLKTTAANLAGRKRTSGKKAEPTGENPVPSGALLPTNTSSNNHVELASSQKSEEVEPRVSKEEREKARAALEAAHPWTPPVEESATVHPLRPSGTDVEL